MAENIGVGRTKTLLTNQNSALNFTQNDPCDLIG